MKKYFGALAAAVLTALGANGAGETRYGDIRSIEAVPNATKGFTYPNQTTPHKVGEDIYILVRLLNEDHRDSVNHEWQIVQSATGIALGDYQATVYWPGLRIAIGSEKVTAEFVSEGPDGQYSGPNGEFAYYTDLYFRYTVKEGQLGLPVRLVNSKDEIIDSAATGLGAYSLQFVNVNTVNGLTGRYWNLINDQDTLAEFWFGPQTPDPEPSGYPSAPSGSQHLETSRLYPGIFVQTIDFEPTYADESDYTAPIWREVYQGISDSVGKDPSIVGTADDEGEATTVYVWSEDDSLVTIDGIPGETVSYVVEGETVTRKVFPVSLTPSGVSPFRLKGGAAAAVNSVTNIVLCATKIPAINAAGQIVAGSTVTRKVRVIAAPSPFITLSDADGNRSVPLVATNNYTAGVRLKMTFSKAYDDGDVKVRLMMNVGSTDIDPVAEKYLFISDSDGADPESTVSLTEITMPRGETETYFYIYPLGTCKELKTTGVTITNLIDQATQPQAYEQFKDGSHRGMTVKLTDQKPVATASMPSSGFKNDTVSVDVMVSDNWRDLSDNNTNGYKVVIYLGGSKVCETNGVKFAENEQISFPVVIPAEGDPLRGTVQVWDQMNNASESAEISIEAKAPLTVSAGSFSSTDVSAGIDTDPTYAEGQTVYLRAVLSSASSSEMYAFIVPLDQASSNLISTTAVTNGLKISTSGDYARYSDYARVRLLDGNVEGRKVNLGVVLKDCQDWNDPAGKVLSTYSFGGSWTLTVTNVAPRFASEGVWGGEDTNRIEVANGATYMGKVSATTPVQFSVKIADAGLIDYTNGTTRVRWTWTDGPADERYVQNMITTVDTNGIARATITFDEESVRQTVTLQVQDRDMYAYDPGVYAPEKYEFTVTVGYVPTVIIEYPEGADTYSETGNSKHNYVTVKVSEWPTASVEGRERLSSSNPLKVRVSLPRDFHPSDNAALHLKSNDVVQVDDDEGVVVTFKTARAATKDGVKVYFDLNSQNGGSGPNEDPSEYIITGEVITDTMASTDQTWSEYYAPVEQPIRIRNEHPTLDVTVADTHEWSGYEGGTNEWTAGEKVKLQWSYTDIAPDVTNANATVSWTLIDVNNKRSVKIATGATDITFDTRSPCNATARGYYEFTVPSSEYTLVTVTARDGDGGEAQYSFVIHVIPTKDVIITPAGPSATSTSKYGTAAGLGQGHIYVENSTGQYMMRQFIQTWMYSETATKASLYAAGYPASDVDALDDGRLGISAGFSQAAEPNTDGGKWVSGQNRFNYRSDYDSYFYCWLFKGADETTMTVQTPAPTTKPATAQPFNPPLDNEKEEATGYSPIEVEAIFSRELYASDNLGDINADEIPDVFVKLYPGFAIYGDDGSVQGNDLMKLGSYNADADYLPAGEATVYANFIPGTSADWVENGIPFSARREIRGWGIALNDAAIRAGVKSAQSERRYTDPRTDTASTLTQLEYLGFITWCARNGHDAADEASWLLWSPENPTDPTLADSDDDGIPDGYEYYIWYRAHVGYLDHNGEYRRLTGRAYNPSNPAEPVIIPSETVAAVYNPNVPNDTLKDSDTDGDGLSDLAEFELGTNPLDYDTDLDGLPDGYEVFITQSDPLRFSSISATGGDGNVNPDNDAKAEMLFEEVPVIGILNGAEINRYTTLDQEKYFATTNTPVGTMTLLSYVSPDGKVTNAYVTTVADITTNAYFGTAAAKGYVYMTTYLPADRTWKCFVQNEGKRVIRGAPAAVEPGMLVKDFRTDVEVLKCTLTAVPGMVYSVWKYDSAGRLVAGQEMHEELTAVLLPTNAVVVEPPSPRNVTLLHHHVYQYNGLAKYNAERTRKVWVPSKAFNPKTAWKVAGGVATSNFTHYDEFMYPVFLHRDTYYYAAGIDLWSGGFALTSGELQPGRDNGNRVTIWQRYCPDGNNADTDGDGTPDGWEAYLFAGVPAYLPDNAPKYKLERLYNYTILSEGSPVFADGSEGGFTRAEEYAGVESTAAYPDCGTIVTANIHPEWTNKLWPTDPHQGDTDGDGIADGEEMNHFLYGNAVSPGSGGGLNPLSWDTDLDGLPDPWEVEFAGEYTPGASTTTVSNTVDAVTGATNMTTTVQRGEGSWEGGMDGTTPDASLDYDNDGLLNWQEYLVGSMRCWRYDDTISSWESSFFDAFTLQMGLFSRAIWNQFWTQYLVSDGQKGDNPDGQYEGYNPRVTPSGYYDPSGNYFSLCENSWDPAAGGWYMFHDGVYHDLANPGEEWQIEIDGNIFQCNRFTWRPVVESMINQDIEPSTGDGGAIYYFGSMDDGYVVSPSKYICCSPIKADTDNDGMDDYYELYHGMNPILGMAGQIDTGGAPAIDLIFEAYGGRPGSTKPTAMQARATANYWMGPDEHPRLQFREGIRNTYDFEAFPWLNGIATADPDGDNIRNQTEAIMTDMQAQSTWLHSDPTPLWMTDYGYSRSLTSRYYVPTSSDALAIEGCPESFTDVNTHKEYYFNDFPGYSWTPGMGGLGTLSVTPCEINRWGAYEVGWSFEQNEGYDTDHDYLSDYDEAAGKTKSSSDVRDSDSPLRRQAMWFPGKNAFLETTIETSEVPPAKLPAGVDLPFLYYTVECWAKPEGDLTREQTLVERAVVTGHSNLGDENFIRKNFLIGMKNGRWYTKYDSAGTDANDPQEILDGPAATTNWTHVAATFDGEHLSLYINGIKYRQKKTGIQPEHGVAAVAIDAVGKLKEASSDYTGSPHVGKPAILVGASVAWPLGVAFDAHWRGWTLVPVTFSDYDRFYQGYIDEVRVWDGARTENEIRDAYRKRFTRDDALANRQAVWEAWSSGIYNRAPSTEGQLPAELKRHWNFDHIPGAARVEDVMPSPAGFSTAEGVVDAKAIWSRPVGWVCPWWNSVAVKSSVYDDRAWVPWITDTVGHLPRLDGTTLDSKYYSEDLLGGVPAADFGFTKFDFPRSAEPYSRWMQVLAKGGVDEENSVMGIDMRYNWIMDKEKISLSDEKVRLYVFTMRHRLVEGFDLLPLGGAYAKRISSAEGGMWDDGTAADAWAQTGVDADYDNLPDWWADYARNNYCDPLDPPDSIGWSTVVSYNGISMPAWQAYLRDLAAGMLSDGVKHPEFADTRDLDGDGIPDWWEDLYKIDTGSKDDATADPDNDGLSNYQEYIISERDSRYSLDPTLSHSVSEDVVDYFLQIKNEKGENVYLGEVYADHDFMEDIEEDANGLDRTRYDANTDADEDGWSAWSEMRYSNYKLTIAQKFVSHLAGVEEVEDYPVPVVHATLRYNGAKVPVGSTAPVIVQAYSGNNLQNEPNAVYTVTPGASEERYLYLGFFEDRVFHGTLTPGWVVNNLNAISLQVAHAQPDDIFSWSIEDDDGNSLGNYSGSYDEMRAAVTTYGSRCKVVPHAFEWADTLGSGNGGTGDGEFALKISSVDSTMKGHILLFNKRAGDIDLITGDFDLDVSVLKSYFMTYGIALPQHFLRIKYQTQLPTLQTKNLQVSLARPDSGKLTEGVTAFVAFVDVDGDGAFTPDTDPIGFVKDVEVGWDQVPSLVIEMTDSSQAAGERFAYGGGSNSVDTLRIIRTSVNGSEEGVKRRIVYSRETADVKRNTVYEGDLVTSGKFGLDWSSLRADINAMENVAAADVTEVGYTVTLGGGSVQNIDPASVVRTFTVEYTTTPVKPTPYSPSASADGIVVSARPEFKWTGAAGYTAFRLQIWEQDGTNAVYNSPLLALPSADASGRFIWTAPAFIGTNSCSDAWVLNNGSSYKWRVAMYNAKFSNTNDTESAWSDFSSFSTQLAKSNDFSTRRGTANVSVRYFGPATNALSSVIVQLYRNADFAGVPAAQSRLNVSDFTAPANSLTNTATVSFYGLDQDEYFAVAFIDRNGNAVRDAYETWGYSAQVGASLPQIWTPSGVKVDPASAKFGSVDVYMEDTDVNRDGILDWNQQESILAVAGAAVASGADSTDVDLDGLTGDEETGDTYTNKQKWDTDGDGIPDGWEARFADTDPLLADADSAVKGDYMAFTVTNGIYRTVTDKDGNKYLVRDTNGVYRVGDVISATNLVTTYDYTTIKPDATLTNFVTVTYAGLGTNILGGADFQIDTIANADVALVHAQVYDEFGYSQSTAIDPADANTKTFTALDKYMLVRYFNAIGMTGASEEAMNVNRTWREFTLKPLDTDCDRDGVADGWELYLMFGTNTTASASKYATPAAAPVSPWKYADRDADLDGDGLTLVDEYAQGKNPSDPWNMYSVYDELLLSGVVPPDAEKFTDARARRFGINAEDYDDDWDLDLISNVQEMWAYYRDMDSLEDIDPENAWSDGFTPDYFRAASGSYLGAIYNGAEFIEPAARAELEVTDLSNAGTRDLFQSGWDVWSIVRYTYAQQMKESEEQISEELSVATKYTYVMYEGYEGVTEEELVAFHVNTLGHVGCISLDAIITAHGGIDAMKRAILEKSSSSLETSAFSVPEPQVNFTFKWAGNGQADVVVDVWQTSSFYPEYGEQLTASYAMKPAFDAGVAYVRAKVAARGTIKQGPARFIAYIDADGNGRFSPGETFGMAEANVGFSDISLVIRLGDGNPSLPTINLVANGTNETERPIQTVAIVRTKVNGQYVSPRGVMLKCYDNNLSRTAIYPSDWINETDGFIGVDKYLAFDAQDDIDPTDETLPAVEEVTYEIVKLRRSFLIEGDDGFKISNTNLNHYIYTEVVEDADTGDTSNIYHTVDQQVNEEFTLRYSVTRDVPLEVKGEAASKVSDTVVSFLVPADRAVTKFWLEIDGSVKGGALDRGFMLANLVSGDVLNTAPGLVGEYTSRRVILDGDWFRENGIVFTEGTHGVRIALGNDKFPAAPTEAAEWSETAEFSVAADAAFVGKVAVRVVHPVVTNENAFTTITVAAYEQEDLANPVATATSVTNGAAVELGGLRTGRKYYLAAWYVKNEKDGRVNAKIRMPYDTWGYLTMLGTETNGFNAASVVATEKSAPTNTIWMQDTDWNDNGVADRLENLKSISGLTPSEAPEWEDVDCDGIPDLEDEDPVFDSSTKSIEGDVMAKATVRLLTVKIGTVELETNWVTYVVYDPEGEPTADRLDGDTIVIPRGTKASELKSLYTTYLYGRKKSAPLGLGVPTNLAEGVVYEHEWKDVALVHHQVYERFGFNPNTANALTASSNWVNTAKFTALDKYIVTNYLAAIGAVVDPASFTNWTLNARRVDFDYDGLTDGWELYTMFGTNAVQALDKTAKADVINAWVVDDRNLDADGDGLTNLHEYDGGFEPTDPWNAYSVYENFFEYGLLLPGTPKFTDMEAKRFGISEADINKDNDNDLLTNLQEIQAYYYDKAALANLDPKKAWSDGATPDYFRVMGSTYLGAYFNGGEFIEPAARKALAIETFSLSGTRDYRHSGWDAWSTARYSLLNMEQYVNIEGVVSDELMLLIRYWNIIRPGEFAGTTVKEAMDFFHEIWAGVVRLIDDQGNVLIEGKNASVSGWGTIHQADAAQTTTQVVAFFGGQAKMEEVIALNKKDITAAEIVTPEPAVNLTLKYAGNASYNLILEAYQVSSAYPEYGEQLTAQWTTPVKFDSGLAVVNEIKTPSLGSLKQGHAKFVAYIDVDGDGKLSAADTFGTTETTVGYAGADVTIRLGDADSHAYPLVRVEATNDCSVVALVRSKINGEPLLGQVRGVVYFAMPNNAAREVIYPSEFFTEDHTGLDKYLRSDYGKSSGSGINLEQIESVTYEVLRLNAADLAGLSVTNLNNYAVVSNGEVQVFGPYQINEEITVNYSNTRDKADVWGVSDSTLGDVTLSFTIPTDGCANMRFWLKIGDKTYNGKHGNGLMIPPAADGVVVLDQDWFDEQGIVFTEGECSFKVLLGNDKFDFTEDGTEWSETATFSINAAAARKGVVAVDVVHPLAGFGDGITVAVYEGSDLAVPAAVITNVSNASTVEVGGLRVGAKYYLAAWYVKDASDGRRSAAERAPYDTWGYYCRLDDINEHGRAYSNGFDPVAVTAAEVSSVTNVIFLQDTDWNDNGVIDRDEKFVDYAGFFTRELIVEYDFDIEGAEEIRTGVSGVMAYAKVPYPIVSTTNEIGETEYYAVVVSPADPASSNVTSVGIAAGTPLNTLKLASTYYYGDDLALGTNVVFASDATEKVISAMTTDIVLVHAQVLDYFGFDPNTANGYIASGNAVNTKDFTARDKEYIVDYFMNVLGVTNATEYVLSDTLADADAVKGGQGDGLPDGWELYMMFKPDGVKDGLLACIDDLTDKSVVFSPWNYDDRNGDVDGDGLSNLLEYDGGANPTNPFDPDSDGDNISDLYAWEYALKGDGADKDLDGDGLSNYAEYLISEVFQFHTLDVRNPRTDGACVDYFRKVGELYLGELFTDHDQVSDLWEAKHPGSPSGSGDVWANRYVYDPAKDLDGDGWSNFAEAKAGTSPELIDSIGVDQETLAEHPVPVIEAKVVYNGYDPISGPLVFRAWSEKFDPGMMHAADAIWTTPGVVSSGNTGASGEEGETASSILTAKKYLGLRPAGRMVYSLGPGSVTPGSVKIHFRDPNFRRAVVRNGVELSVSEAGVSQAKWYALIQDKNGELVTSITNQQAAVSVGSIDYTTGRVEIDFGSAALAGDVYASMVNASASNESIDQDTTRPMDYYNCEKIDLDASYVKIAWSRMRVGSNIGGTYYLGDPDKPGAVSSSGEGGDSESSNFSSASRGYVREGLNSFVVFADQNGDGDYTAGEPFGYVNGVDVGWQGAKFTVELTGTSPVFARVNVKTEENDRIALYGIYSDTITITNLELTADSAESSTEEVEIGRYMHVRVDRHSVNGVPLGIDEGQVNLPDRILVDKYMDLGVRSFIHEGDFISEGEFDIDWSHFDEIAFDDLSWVYGDDPITVGYRVVVDNSLHVSPVTNNVSLSYVFTRRFDSYDNRQLPVDLANVVSYGAKPTFSWSMGKSNTYTAFRLQVLEGGTVVYDSGINRAPVLNADGRYEWTAPIAPGDQMPSGKVLSAAGNYTWNVTMYNSKFRYDGYSETPGTFRTIVNQQQDVDDNAYNAVAACVKYTGPANVLGSCDTLTSVSGKVRLQAFTTADFSGGYASQTFVTNKDVIADASINVANAKVIGLPAGTYYLRAYIDSNGNFKKDDWESWGAAAEPVTVGAGIAMPVVGIYIEDADTDGDWVPDAYEYVTNGDLVSNDGKAVVSGEFVLTKKLADAIAGGSQDAGVSTVLPGVTLSAFQYADAMNTLLGAGMISGSSSMDAIREAVEKTVKNDTVKITSISFDPVNNKVVLAVDAEVTDSIAGEIFSKIYDLTSAETAKVTVKVYKKDSLVQADWDLVKTVADVEVGKTAQYVEVDLGGGDYTSGFYRVEIEQ